MRIQVALDDIELDSTIRMISELELDSRDIVEIGTPLICWNGKDAFHAIRSQVKTNDICVDLKSLDFGTRQVIPFLDLGAKFVTVHACLEFSQLIDCISCCSRYDALLYLSFLGCDENSIRRVTRPVSGAKL